MQKRTRALRRHHNAVKKQNVLGHLTFSWRLRNGETIPKREIGILAKTPHNCSCWMCGNQRKHFGSPLREERQLQMADIRKGIDNYFTGLTDD